MKNLFLYRMCGRSRWFAAALRSAVAAVCLLVAGCSVGEGGEEPDEPVLPVSHGTYRIIVGTSPEMLELSSEIRVDWDLTSGTGAGVKLRSDMFGAEVPTVMSAACGEITLAATLEVPVSELPDTVAVSLSFRRNAAASVGEEVEPVPVCVRGYFEGVRGEDGDTVVYAITQRTMYVPQLQTSLLDDYFRQLNSAFNYVEPLSSR